MIRRLSSIVSVSGCARTLGAGGGAGAGGAATTPPPFAAGAASGSSSPWYAKRGATPWSSSDQPGSSSSTSGWGSLKPTGKGASWTSDQDCSVPHSPSNAPYPSSYSSSWPVSWGEPPLPDGCGATATSVGGGSDASSSGCAA